MSEWDDMPPLEDEEPIPNPHNPPTNTHARFSSLNGFDNSDDDDDDSDAMWEEMEEEEENTVTRTKCVFCDEYKDNVPLSINHMRDGHGFDLPAFVCRWGMDQMDFIKFVNYMRRENPSPETVLKIDEMTWDNEYYMKPVLEDDVLLMFDVEEIASAIVGRVVGEDKSLQATCEELREIIDKQRETMQRMFQAVTANSVVENKSIRTVSDMRPEEDEGYFNSYAHFDIHHEMLSDKVRTESYRDAILRNSPLLHGMRVLDLGCGTGILSMFSAKAGAYVTGVDMSDVIYQAMDIVKENQLEDVITLKRGRIEDIEIEDKFDFIVSEWMGYFLLFEGMLDSVIYARDNYLIEGGFLLPNRCSMYITGMEDLEAYNKYIAFWDDVYGFKMSCMRSAVIKEATTEVVKEECIITSEDKIMNFDLMKITSNDTEFTSSFFLIAKRDGQLTAFVGYFDIYFELPHPVSFSTGPLSTPTHWKQTIFYLPEPRNVELGETIQGVISVRRKRREVRSLDVMIKFEDKKYYYMVE
ncbi:Protein arginine N-methyltransferase 3 [Halocaridina rubra]|uniref:type I protein arginine methyltransferase n=1 Tax=Halocaridina rubra TaxID=373956 RepID=A0AAN8ZT60_HALRR